MALASTGNATTSVIPPKGYQLIVNPGFDVWEEVQGMIREFKLDWFVHDKDYDTWIEGIGDTEFNLTVILEVARNIVTAFVATYKLGTEKPYYGFSFFFVRPTHRHMGLGQCIWDYALTDPIFVNNNFGMLVPDHLVEKLNYFQVTGAFKIQIAKALCSDLVVANLPLPAEGSKIRVTGYRNAIELKQFDMLINGGTNRTRYLNKLFKVKNCIARYVAFDLSGEQPEIVGFCALHFSNERNLSVTPLYAKSQEIAGGLLKRALDHLDLTRFHEISFYVPNTNPVARKFYVNLTAGSLVQDSALTLKYVREAPTFKTDYIFSICDCTMSII
uniref:N-acetyltransferase domain-containing protein n=1 Tax=Panagrellus redivivus TaxID=6233 RepID=A0A7E4V812_PANRE